MGSFAAKSTRYVLPILSDTHGGHKLGLMNPDVELQDETENGQLIPYKPKPTASQEYLWRLYKELIWQSVQIANGAPMIVIHNGDIAQGNKYPSELVSTRMADQILIGLANLSPWLEIGSVAAMRMAFGSEAHVFGEGSAEILVADGLKGRYPDKDISVCHHGLPVVGGVAIDYAHHGPFPGSRSWLRGNAARYYLQDLMMSEIMAGNTPPRLYLRAHFHSWVQETVTVTVGNVDYVSTLLVTPSFCMMGEHGHKATRSAPAITNGLAVIEIVDGELHKIHRLTRTLDIRSRERIE